MSKINPRSDFHQNVALQAYAATFCFFSATLRANPFPEVTDLICRLPLPTLFYRPEASHLGDLMRLRVRSKMNISLPKQKRHYKIFKEDRRYSKVFQKEK